MRKGTQQWMLPAGIEESLPDQARQLEWMRFKILRVFDSWGYDLVVPPMLEYLESLLVISDEELNTRTLKVVDQLNGRMMGLRPDITPQVARIDAHRMNEPRSNRLCYIGTVLYAQPMDVTGIRATTQFGAEIYGDSSIQSDAEIILLMLESLRSAGVAKKDFKNLHIDLGHIGIYLALVEQAGLSAEQSSRLLGLVQMKSAHEIREYLRSIKARAEQIEEFVALIQLHGSTEVIDKAWEAFKHEPVRKIIRQMKQLSALLKEGGVATLNYDFSDLVGYHYETGIVFSVFHQGTGCPIARGGRYDNIGKAFGRARSAKGFSSDLKLLETITSQQPPVKQVIFADVSKDPGLRVAIQELRWQGKRVVQQLSKKETPKMLHCTHQLVYKTKRWQVEPV